MIEDKIRKYKIHNELALKEYLKLTSVSNIDKSIYCEMHHILPKSMFPEYRSCKWNLVRLDFEQHKKAHELLLHIFNNGEMKRAYLFINRSNLNDRIRHMCSGAFTGNKNPAKRKSVREKIRNSKLGKSRPDLKGKSYFGASKETIKDICEKYSKYAKNTVIVRDSEGSRFRVSREDPRYLSGELVPFNKGISNINSGSKNPEVMSRIMSSREKTYSKFSKMSFDEMVDFLVNASISGKNIFAKTKPFAKNYSGYVKRTKFDANELYNAVVQRLSKDANANRVE